MNDIKRLTREEYMNNRWTFRPTDRQKHWPLSQVKLKQIEVKEVSSANQLMRLKHDYEPGFGLHVPKELITEDVPF